MRPTSPLTAIEAGRRSTRRSCCPSSRSPRHWNERPDDLRVDLARASAAAASTGRPRPFRTYTGDSVWTYELGSKYASADRRLSASRRDLLQRLQGLHRPQPVRTRHRQRAGDGRPQYRRRARATAPSSRSLSSRRRAWTLTGGASYVHARITDSRSTRETNRPPARARSACRSSPTGPSTSTATMSCRSATGDLTLHRRRRRPRAAASAPASAKRACRC